MSTVVPLHGHSDYILQNKDHFIIFYIIRNINGAQNENESTMKWKTTIKNSITDADFSD